MAYAYHVTLSEFLPSIRRYGLRPHEHEWLDEPGIFVEDDEEAAMTYHTPPKTAVLRFRLPPTAVLDYYSEDLPEYVWFDVVPPTRIEYKTRGVWAPLIKKRKD